MQSSISSALWRLSSASVGERLAGALDLGALVDNSFGAEAQALGECVRTRGGIALLVHRLDDEPAVTQAVLQVLGNLSSDAVDAHSAETKKLLALHGAVELSATQFKPTCCAPGPAISAR